MQATEPKESSAQIEPRTTDAYLVFHLQTRSLAMFASFCCLENERKSQEFATSMFFFYTSHLALHACAIFSTKLHKLKKICL